MDRNEVERAKFLIDLKRYRDAELLLGEIIARNPDKAVAHRLLSLALTYQKRPLEGLFAAEKAIGLAPEEAAGYFVKALALIELKNASAARQTLLHALSLNPNQAEYHAKLCVIYARQGEWRKVLKQAQRGLQVDPTHRQCANLYALASAWLGQHDQSEQVHRMVLTEDPEYAAAYNNRGMALLHQGKFDEAKIFFQESLRLNPLEEAALHNLDSTRHAKNPLYRWMLRYTLWMGRMLTKCRALAVLLFPMMLLAIFFLGVLRLYRWVAHLVDKLRGV